MKKFLATLFGVPEKKNRNLNKGNEVGGVSHLIQIQPEDKQKTVRELEENSSSRQTPVTHEIQDEMTNKNEEQPKNKGKLFVGGLNSATTSRELKTYFSRFGQVVDAIVITNPTTQTSRRFGFVTFLKPEDAEKTLQTKVHVLDGKKIDLRPYGHRDEEELKESTESRVYLGQLPYDITKADLNTFFSRYGEVGDICIPRDRATKQGKGFAFLSFKDEYVAEKCVADRYVYLKGRRVLIKKADPRHVRLNRDARGSDDLGPTDSDDLESFYPTDSTCSRDDDVESVISAQEFEFGHLDHPELQLFQQNFGKKLVDFHEMNKKKVDHVTDVERIEKFLKGLSINIEEHLTPVSVGDGDDRHNVSSLLSSAKFDGRHDVYSFDESARNEISLGKGRSDLRFQKSQFKDDQGNYICSICNWKSSAPSLEMFLSHCKTVAHRKKIKARFKDLETGKLEPRPKPALNSERSKLVQPELRSHPKVVNNEKGDSKTGNKTQGAQKSGTVQQTFSYLEQMQPAEQKLQETQRLKKKEKVQKEDSKQQEQEQKRLNPEEKSKTEAVPKDKNKKQKSESEQQKSHQEIENQSTSNGNLKAYALASGMACIQPLPNGTLMCDLCNKCIPRAFEFDVLMKNTAQHLQSKTHLRRLLQTEDVLKDLISQGQKEEQTRDSDSKSFEEEDPKEKNAPAKKVKAPKQSKALAVEEPKIVPENQISKTKDPPKPRCEAPKPSKPEQKKPQTGTKNSEKVDESEAKFICLQCNYSNKDVKVFGRHLKSKFHSGTCTGDEQLNCIECEFCHTYLYGSLYDINLHYFECLNN